MNKQFVDAVLKTYKSHLIGIHIDRSGRVYYRLTWNDSHLIMLNYNNQDITTPYQKDDVRDNLFDQLLKENRKEIKKMLMSV